MTSTTLRALPEVTIAREPALSTSAAAGASECTNCGIARAGLYCAVCGQRFTHGRLTVPAIAHQVAHDVLNLDRGILFTAMELTRRPGDAIRAYVDGKRVRYTGPVKYFILTVALTTFATTQLGIVDEVAEGMFHEAERAASMTPSQASAFMSRWMTMFMALGVPFTAAVTHRLFKRTGMTYAEHLALNLYSYGHQCVGLVLALLVASMLPSLEGGMVVLWMFASTGYFAWTCTRFFRIGPRVAVPRAVLGVLLGTAMYFLTATLVIGAAFGVAGL
ncbi:MAG TPA: DUF3667 domain-containing protein [Longimicrobium sp.]|nr:DUF3667 domain-containing protein [Longimicrobium sp.]